MAALIEVRETIDESLKDPRGLLPRQRRLMAALSLGMQHLIEVWLQRLGAIRPGACVKHEWFHSEERNLRLRLAGILTKDLKTLRGADRILAIAHEVEANRNDIVYGAPLARDLVLREKLECFLELKKTVEKETGDVKWN